MNGKQICHAIEANLSPLKLSDAKKEQIHSSIKDENKPSFSSKMHLRIIIPAAILMIGAILATALGMPQQDLSFTQTDASIVIAVSKTDDAPDYSQDIRVSDDVRNVWGNEVADFLIDSRAYVSLPTWKPENCTLSSIDIKNHQEESPWCSAIFMNSNNASIDIYISLVEPLDDRALIHSFRSEGGDIEKHCIDGIDYYFEFNKHNSFVVWAENNCIVKISTETGQDDLHRMVDSIGA